MCEAEFEVKEFDDHLLIRMIVAFPCLFRVMKALTRRR